MDNEEVLEIEVPEEHTCNSDVDISVNLNAGYVPWKLCKS